jgi:hypothetical protein
MSDINRRAWLAGSAAALAGGPSFAAAPKANTQGPGVYRYKLGDYQVTALYDGLWSLKIDDEFVRNADSSAVNKALAGGIPAAEHPADFVHRAAGQHRIEARV